MLTKEFRLVIRDARKFLFDVPKNKTERREKFLFATWMIGCATLILALSLIRVIGGV